MGVQLNRRGHFRSFALEGFDVGELDPTDGWLKRITGCFGPFPPIPDSWPPDQVHRE
jgi:hypothetical protein